jgi:ABC-type sugar transport system substrate-binding protein
MKENRRLKAIAAVLACAVLFTDLAFAGGKQEQEKQTEARVKIGVALYEDSGPAVTAVRAFLAGIGNDVNCEFVYSTLDMMDESKNKTVVQNLISAGCQGLILTMDSGTEAIMEECRKANVFVGGFLTDYDISYESIKNHPNFVGTVCDGAYLGTGWGNAMAERIIAEGRRNVGIIKFPAWAFPHQVETDVAFREKIGQYNAANPGKEITLPAETLDLMFSPLDSTYFSENPNLDAIFGICAGTQFIYPTQVAAGKTNIKLYTAGFTVTADILNNFGTKGNACIQELRYSNVEAIVYPLVLLLNKLRGAPFSDQPAAAQRIDSSYISIRNDADLQAVMTKSMYYTGKYESAFLTGAEVKALLASNGGTFAKLKETVNSMTIADLVKR